MKVYMKPEIAFEDFSLSTNIAAGCDISAGWTSMTCAYTVGGSLGSPLAVFVDGNTACTYKEESGVYNEICYDVPSSNYSLYAS